MNADRLNETKLNELIQNIMGLDKQSMDAVRERQDTLTKPPGSLGVLEDISTKIAGIQATAEPVITKKAVIVMAADNGVVDEGVSAFPQEVTAQMILNFLNGGAGINAIARQVKADVLVVDIGISRDVHADGLIVKKTAYGTKNFVNGPAMSREDCIKAIGSGIEIVNDLANKGYDLIATGEMGIGNTTTSAAILATYHSDALSTLVGNGTGISDEGKSLKVKTIEKAILVNQPNTDDPIDVLSKLGGFDIAGLAGVIIGAALNKIPVVIDGFISGAAALVASKIAPASLDFMIASHVSMEPGHRKILEMLDLRPCLYMDMRLGEGTGAAIGMSICEIACKTLNEMATFEDAMVSNKLLEEQSAI